MRARLSNGAALHCYYVQGSSFFCFYCVSMCVLEGIEEATLILSSTTHDDFTVLSFRWPSLFRRVICQINSLYSGTSHEHSFWRQHSLSLLLSVKHTPTHTDTHSFTIICPSLCKYKLAALAWFARQHNSLVPGRSSPHGSESWPEFPCLLSLMKSPATCVRAILTD